MGLYAHITWHTYRRERTLRAADVPVVASAILAAAERTRVRVHAQAALTEHVHVVVSFAPDASLSAFVREAKSEAARRVNHARCRPPYLQWCRGFYAGTLSRSHVRSARVYVARQHGRHPHLVPD